MTDRLTEADALAAVPRLTRTRLVTFIDSRAVTPPRGTQGYVFRQIDIARLELLCDLTDDLDLDDTAVDVVLSLIDQLHAARQDLRAVARAIDAQPPDLKARIANALRADPG
jgi:chaperone modulatory protein CbpM